MDKDGGEPIGEFFEEERELLNKQNENALKNLITTPAVKYRRPYAVYIEDYPHLASFMASVNGNEFLTDPPGSRRFLPFEVLRIDKPTAESIRMDNVYSEDVYKRQTPSRTGRNTKAVHLRAADRNRNLTKSTIYI